MLCHKSGSRYPQEVIGNMLLEEKIYLLQLIRDVNKGEEVSIPSVDRRIIRKYPEIIYQSKLKMYLSDLEEEGYLAFVDAITLQLTQKGKDYLTFYKPQQE